MNAKAPPDVDPAEFAVAKAVASELLGAEVRSDDTVRWFVKIMSAEPERLARFRALNRDEP